MGRVVHAIIREFEKHPPAIISEESSQTLTNVTNHQLTSNPQHHRCSEPAAPVQFANNTLFDISTLSLDELIELNNNTEYLHDFAEDLNIIDDLNKELDNLISDVEAITG